MGIEVINVATHKILSHTVLNTADEQFRFMIGTPDPKGKFFYTVTKEITQYSERIEVAKPKYTIVDLEQGKIVKTVEIPKEEEAPEPAGLG
jgi:hypothetical protein